MVHNIFLYFVDKQSIVFENFYIQAGNDHSGVPTDMLSLNSTVKILYRNPATFFGVHVTATPLQLQYYQLQLASGQVCNNKFSTVIFVLAENIIWCLFMGNMVI